jgi:O-antigen/teichoic acid export membrane protein
MIAARFAERSLGLLSTLILVRLLLPADFGIVAMAISIIAVVEIIGAFGFDTVLIYRQDASREQYDTAWTFKVIVAAATAVLLLLLAVPAARFYGEPELAVVIVVLAASSFVQGFENIGIVDFRKALQFDKEFAYILYRKLISFGLTIPLAFMLRNYWALVIGTVVSKVAGVVLSFVLHSYRPRLSLAARSTLFNFSKWLMLNNLILLARDRSADFTIGRFLGSHDLGLYSVSYEVSNLPTQQLAAPINRAVFPGYAKQAHDLSELRASFVQVMSILWMCALPAGAGIAVTAPVLVPVVLGQNWLEAIPLLRILAAFGTLMIMQANIGYVFYALGSPRTTTMLTLGYVAILLPLLIALTATEGAVGAAWANLVTTAMFVPISLTIVFRRLQCPVQKFVSAVWRTLAAVGVMLVGVVTLLRWTGDAAPFAALAGSVVAGIAIYVATLATLWVLSGRPSGAESVVLERFSSALRGRRLT